MCAYSFFSWWWPRSAHGKRCKHSLWLCAHCLIIIWPFLLKIEVYKQQNHDFMSKVYNVLRQSIYKKYISHITHAHNNKILFTKKSCIESKQNMFCKIYHKILCTYIYCTRCETRLLFEIIASSCLEKISSVKNGSQ